MSNSMNTAALLLLLKPKREELARWLCRRALIRQPGLPGGVAKNVDALWHHHVNDADEILALIASEDVAEKTA